MTPVQVRGFWEARQMQLLFGLFAFCLCSCSAQSSSSAVAVARRAQELYDDGQYQQVEELLRQLLEQEGPSATLLYNLGCAFYRNDRLGQAIAAWESARLLEPRDPDLLHNLRVASSQQIDRLPEVQDSLMGRLLDRWVLSLNLDEWTLIAYGTYLLLLGAFGVRLFLRSSSASVKDHWATAMFVVCGIFLLSGLGLGRSLMSYHQSRAVVIASECDVFSGPDGSGEKVTTVHAGLVLEVTGVAGTDSRVRLPTGWQGFLPSQGLWPVSLEGWEARETAMPAECGES